MEQMLVTVDPEIAELIPRFLERKREAAGAILEAAARADFAALGALGHNLKGEGGAFGFNRLSEIGAALEQAAEAEDLAAATRLARDVSAYLENVEVVIAGPGEG